MTTKLLVLLCSPLLGLLLTLGYVLYAYRKTARDIWKNRYLFRYTYFEVRAYLWVWTKNQFFSHGLWGALSCTFLMMPLVQLPAILGKESSWLINGQIAMFMGLFGASLAYLSTLTGLKIFARKWGPWLDQNPDLIEKAKAHLEEVKARKFKQHLVSTLPASSKSVSSLKRRL